jgi:hypothetical protein
MPGLKGCNEGPTEFWFSREPRSVCYDVPSATPKPVVSNIHCGSVVFCNSQLFRDRRQARVYCGTRQCDRCVTTSRRMNITSTPLGNAAATVSTPSVIPQTLPGGHTILLETAMVISYSGEVSQVYFGFPSRAGEPCVLRGFNRTFIGRGDRIGVDILGTGVISI